KRVAETVRRSSAKPEASSGLADELAEALQRQTATAEILKVIARSPSDIQPVFDAIAESARRLIGAQSAIVTRVVGDALQLVALTAANKAGRKALRDMFPSPISSKGAPHGRVASTGRPAIYNDIPHDPDMLPRAKAVAKAWGFRSLIIVPILREG